MINNITIILNETANCAVQVFLKEPALAMLEQKKEQARQEQARKEKEKEKKREMEEKRKEEERKKKDEEKKKNASKLRNTDTGLAPNVTPFGVSHLEIRVELGSGVEVFITDTWLVKE